MAKPKPKTNTVTTTAQRISIPKLETVTSYITIEGSSPLLVNRFDEKSKQEIDDKYRGVAKNKKVPLSPEEEYLRTLYIIDDSGKKPIYGIPAAGVKNCAVTACRFVGGLKATVAQGAFHVLPHPKSGDLVAIEGTPSMDERTVRVGTFGNKKPATRRRAKFNNWKCTFKVQYNPAVINASQLANLYENAGFGVGLCEYRPEKKGNMGMFTVVKGA